MHTMGKRKASCIHSLANCTTTVVNSEFLNHTTSVAPIGGTGHQTVKIPQQRRHKVVVGLSALPLEDQCTGASRAYSAIYVYWNIGNKKSEKPTS